MKAQINIEFLMASLLFFSGIALMSIGGVEILPGFSEDIDRGDATLEAERITTEILTYEGSPSNWEENPENTQRLGLSNGNYFEISRSKIKNLTTSEHNTNREYFNYSQFLEVTDTSKQFQFNFRWMPIIHTPESFIRENPPSDPNIQEPSTDHYESSDNRVHYGSETLNGTEYYFLVTAQHGTYQDVYINDENLEWDFTVSDYWSHNDPENNVFDLGNNRFEIENIQNRENKPGATLILSQEINRFGASPDSGEQVIRLDRFGSLENHPMRIEVLAW